MVENVGTADRRGDRLGQGFDRALRGLDPPRGKQSACTRGRRHRGDHGHQPTPIGHAEGLTPLDTTQRRRSPLLQFPDTNGLHILQM